MEHDDREAAELQTPEILAMDRDLVQVGYLVQEEGRYWPLSCMIQAISDNDHLPNSQRRFSYLCAGTCRHSETINRCKSGEHIDMMREKDCFQ